jgi:hypothetical protein
LTHWLRIEWIPSTRCSMSVQVFKHLNFGLRWNLNVYCCHAESYTLSRILRESNWSHKRLFVRQNFIINLHSDICQVPCFSYVCSYASVFGLVSVFYPSCHITSIPSFTVCLLELHLLKTTNHKQFNYAVFCIQLFVFLDSRQGQESFLYSAVSIPALGPTQPPIQRVPEVKRPGREADHSPPSNAEVENGGAIRPLPYTSSWSCA